MAIPKNSIGLVLKAYKKIFPSVRQELAYWKKRAEAIPNEELKRQALLSMKGKDFHSEGGAIFALIAEERYRDVIKFIVSYQTISDYLDNLCDRSNSLDPRDFSALHQAMEDALDVERPIRDYYKYRLDRDDGGYLAELVETCRSFLRTLPNYPFIKERMLELCQYYCDLQVHKHVTKEERLKRLKNWFATHCRDFPRMEWYEFSACCGSTLGIFCLVAYAARKDFQPKDAEYIQAGYFPYIQGFHILLDYFIDQEEDRLGGDLNFCFYYDHQQKLQHRLTLFFTEADRHAQQLPHAKFHRLINRGLLGVYLSDDKVKRQPLVKEMAMKLMKLGGWTSYFFYLNGKGYRLWKQISR